MLISININFAYFSVVLDDIIGQLFFLSSLTLAGAEAALGLGILIIYYRIRGVITTQTISSLKG